ncbi:MAG: glutamate-5-semialdehyde dehydrogenase [Alphaproteobacteria bacterium RIFCSPLOWO2_01_FULL_40_26]|nr:MAG: glutamate-5-semialdehyde dehydrogenase [Alphaproteobacteria bacterium RIFCSPHIGHO2_02_FULL_40_34]OFW88634.1 MAG: glutamate-5-semialdehyde dehydrogenase [Alphaproteobacteria bacterium RIFCSPHIGHO2_01_FULL_40_8]OFW95469.1 MAG: glutamate-5-semialdehyde dehydrogenase [Alphaproteobacteria bacterium RIFCSPLOWO2_01_FULL_40_26]OFX10276.1 MAG: glutamate-5-semialdehyde dehydrogenase [Alphaproteobacteria bacterium RIFCSPLOWO2_02_FULL_40_19]OFX11528.1 MAG: glutamate-5-semialdehyde dehydrogenase [Al
MSEIKTKVLKICEDVKKASAELANLESTTKDQILLEVVKLLKKHTPKIIKANQKDLKIAKEHRLDIARIDRLTLDEKRIANIINAVKDVIKLKDPVGKILYDITRENGLRIRRISTPLGVLLAIYESRPNVTSDIAALSLKSGNAVILRCGSDCVHSSKIIADVFREALERFNVDKNSVILVANIEREYVLELLKMENHIDIVIPRGGKSLIKAVMENTKIPVFRHLDGNCHTYIHEKADFNKARKILLNAKMRRVGICGATESLLIDKKIAKKILPLIADDLSEVKCEMRGCAESAAIDQLIRPAEEKDFYTEYLDKIISIKLVRDIDEAIKHIAIYGSSHTESIITEDKSAAEKFLKKVNSAIVMHNASTQFADGGEFGLGAEVGIATGKLHARGPVGLEQLTIYKYIVEANCGLR